MDSEKKTRLLREIVESLSLEELRSYSVELEPGAGASDDEIKAAALRSILSHVKPGKEFREAVRGAIHEKVGFGGASKAPVSGGGPAASGADEHAVEGKNRELREMLDGLDGWVRDLDMASALKVFSALLEVQSQICSVKTGGVIVVRTRLESFFPIPAGHDPNKPRRDQEIGILFAPEEVRAIQSKLESVAFRDPFRPFLAAIIEEARDSLRFNELAGLLLLNMTGYFIARLEAAGHADTVEDYDFRERHERAARSFAAAAGELRDAERAVESHLARRPVLSELPAQLRKLIQIRIGLLDAKHTHETLRRVASLSKDYLRAKGAAAIDFNRLGALQQTLRIRERAMLALQRDILARTAEAFEKEYESAREDCDRLLGDLGTALEKLDSGSPGYLERLERKAALRQREEESRRRLDVVRSQAALAEIVHQMVDGAIGRHREKYGGGGEIPKRNPPEAGGKNEATPMKKKSIHRMARSRRRGG